jgi:hypothetical protein
VPIVGGGSRHLLEVAGTRCGEVILGEGGWGFADVIEEPSPTGVKKRPGQPRWEELELRLGLPVARPVVDWIAAAWRRDVQAKDVAVTTADAEWNALRRREFRNALLTATTIATAEPVSGSGFPSSSGSGFATLRLLPQAARTMPASGTVTAPTSAHLRPLYPRLELPGLDCTMIRPIGAFTVRQAFGSAIPASPGLRVWLEPGPLSFPNLTVELPESSASDWHRWFENFVVQGYNDDTNEKTGTLTLEDDIGRGRVRIGLFNVGIFQLKGPIESAERPPYVVAGLYCERMDFTLL